MIQSRKSLRLLDILSGIAILVAVILYVLPVRVSVPAASPMPKANTRPTAPSVVVNDNEAATVVASNILSSSRHAPAVRYISPELLPAVDYTMPPAFATGMNSESPKAAPDDPDAVPSLYGIVNADGTWRALLRLVESDVSPVLLREGDRRGAYVVVSIRPNAVVVAGPSGQRTLRLNRASRSDSTGKSP